MKTEVRNTSCSNPETDLDKLAVEIAEIAENAIGYILGDKWKATPILAHSEKDDEVYPAAIILENVSLVPVDENIVPEFKRKIAEMVLTHASDMFVNAVEKYRK